MIDAQKLLGVDVMTGHWEFTYGAERVKEVVEKDFAGKIDFVAQNVKTADFGDPVFAPYVDPRRSTACRWRSSARRFRTRRSPIRATSFPSGRSASRKRSCRRSSTKRAAKGAQVVVLLSHNGMDVDLKLASRVTRHRRDPRRPHARRRAAADDRRQPRRHRRSSPTPAATASSSAVLDLDVRGGKVADFRYRLLPVFAQPAAAGSGDGRADRQACARRIAAKLDERLATTEGLLYRRGNFNGTLDQLILDALMAEKDARDRVLARLPLGHDAAARARRSRMEHLMDQTAITYPYVTVNELTGETIKTILEDVADNLFNPDPYYQQGGDMVRVGGLAYAIDPTAAMGKRITRMELRGQADRGGEDVQGRRLGAGLRGGEGRGRRADLGRGRALPARAEERSSRAS